MSAPARCSVSLASTLWPALEPPVGRAPTVTSRGAPPHVMHPVPQVRVSGAGVRRGADKRDKGGWLVGWLGLGGWGTPRLRGPHLCTSCAYFATTPLAIVPCTHALRLSGFFCPEGTGLLSAALSCASPEYYCPAGSSWRSVTPSGSFAVALPSGVYHNTSMCRAGEYCVAGVAVPCPGGRYGSLTGGINASCTGSCTQGFFCPPGSTRPDPTPCGSVGVFCPQVG